MLTFFSYFIQSVIAEEAQIKQLAQELQALVQASLSSNLATSLPPFVTTGDRIYFKVS